jgi:hypothetical protein
MTDKLIDCPNCNEKAACYQIPMNEFHNSYMCFGCGFISNDLMKVGEFDIEQYESSLPELYKDLKSVDNELRVWYPQVINIQGMGTVFANGNNRSNWQWSAIKSIPLTKQEMKNPKFKGQTHKSDSESLKNFGKDFIEACDYINFFNVEK